MADTGGMALRRGNRGPQGAAGDPVTATAQDKALDLAEAFHDADRSGLERLDPVGRAEQEQLRTAFYMYADALWDNAKAQALAAHGDDYDAASDPAYSGVAGMRDLVAEMMATVHEVQASAGDET
jgi:hypothetical protein